MHIYENHLSSFPFAMSFLQLQNSVLSGVKVTEHIIDIGMQRAALAVIRYDTLH